MDQWNIGDGVPLGSGGIPGVGGAQASRLEFLLDPADMRTIFIFIDLLWFGISSFNLCGGRRQEASFIFD
jgi:hypothetical protein